MADRRSVVTGADGFLGRRLVRRLVERGDAVTRLIGPSGEDRDPEATALDGVRTESWDCTGDDLPDVDGADTVWHLAAISLPGACEDEPALAREVNVAGTRRALAAAGAWGADTFVLFSTGAVYGIAARVPTPEDEPRRPLGVYAETKAAAEREVEKAEGPERRLVLRCFNAYGPGQPPGTVVPTVASQVARSDAITLNNTDSVRDFIFADDLVAGAVALEAGDDDGIFNLGTGRGRSIGDLVDAAAAAVGRDVKVTSRHLPAAVRRLVADPTRARESVGWTADTTLEAGVAAVMAASAEDGRNPPGAAPA